MAAGRRPKVNVMTTQNEPQPNEAAKPVDTSSPEFQTAVAFASQAAVDKAMGPVNEMLARIAAAQPSATTGAEYDAQKLFSQMALAIAEISDQGTNRKRVAPEILAQRTRSHALMIEAIIEAKRAHDERGEERPKYRAIGKMYLNERFIEPFTQDPATKKPVPVELYWSGVPNEVMRPMNAVADGIFKHFRDSIGSVDKTQEQTALWISAGGLVIVGEGPARRAVGEMDESGRPAPSLPAFDDDLSIPGQTDPTKPFVQVLGSVAPAARQNYADMRGN